MSTHTQNQTTATTYVFITNMLPRHAAQVEQLLRRSEGMSPDQEDYRMYSTAQIIQHIRKFPEGQFVALIDGKVVGFALTMRTNRSPYAKPQRWLEAIGGLDIRNHDPEGQWLYGVEFAVDPDYRRAGIGGQLYAARFAMIERLNLRGFYAGGMLQGYRNYASQMSIEKYAEQVKTGQIYDPTVSMQMKRGFKPISLIRYYTGDEPIVNEAMLIYWENPHYQEVAVGV